MPHLLTASAILGTALTIVACDRSRTPLEPTPPSHPLVTSIALHGPAFVHLGENAHMSVDATAADGTIVVPPEKVAWSVDSASLLTVDKAGQIRGVRSGIVTIRGEVAGRSASTTMRVLPNYEGSWSGEYERTRCSGRNCGPLNERLPLRLTLQQHDDAVQGTLEFGPDPGNVRGTITLDGRLLLDGIWDYNDPHGPFEWKSTNLYEWTTIVRPDDLRRMTGTLRYGVPYFYEITGTITGLVK